MPRENRKRGKKFKHKEEVQQEPDVPLVEDQGNHEIPSWIVSAPEDVANADLPFGELDAEVKAYFRTADLQIRDWQTEDSEKVSEDDPNAGMSLPPLRTRSAVIYHNRQAYIL
jgi:nucleolar protein 9